MIATIGWIVAAIAYGGIAVGVGVAIYMKLKDRDAYDPEVPATSSAAVWPVVGVWVLLALIVVARVERARDRRELAAKENERFMEAARKELRDLGA